jgi:hypothetical protein
MEDNFGNAGNLNLEKFNLQGVDCLLSKENKLIIVSKDTAVAIDDIAYDSVYERNYPISGHRQTNIKLLTQSKYKQREKGENFFYWTYNTCSPHNICTVFVADSIENLSLSDRQGGYICKPIIQKDKAKGALNIKMKYQMPYLKRLRKFKRFI